MSDDDCLILERPRKTSKRSRVSSSDAMSTHAADEISSLRRRIETLEDQVSQLDGKRRAANALKSVFMCLICRDAAYKNDACVSTCCNVIIGHQQCIDQWLANDAVCPHCRAELNQNFQDSRPVYTLMPAIKPLQSILDDCLLNL